MFTRESRLRDHFHRVSEGVENVGSPRAGAPMTILIVDKHALAVTDVQFALLKGNQESLDPSVLAATARSDFFKRHRDAAPACFALEPLQVCELLSLVNMVVPHASGRSANFRLTSGAGDYKEPSYM